MKVFFLVWLVGEKCVVFFLLEIFGSELLIGSESNVFVVEIFGYVVDVVGEIYDYFV